MSCNLILFHPRMNVSEGGYVIDRREYNEKMAWYLGIKSDAISKVYLSDNKTEVSATSGYITFVVAYGANQYVGQLPFQVNVARYTGELTLTNKQFKVSMDGLTTRMETAEGDITDVNTKLTNEVASLHSEITTTATNVKAEVTEQISGNLKKAGLEVKADGVTLYGDKITITNDNGKTTTALFANGKINASLIDVKHLWAISEDGTSKVGYFGNTEEDACKIGDGTLAPLFIGGDTAAKSPFYVTSNGAMHATSGTIGGFSIRTNQLHSDGSGYAFDIYTDRLVYTDNANQRTLLISSDSDDGLQLSLTAAEENMACKLMVGKQDGVGGVIGLLASKTGYEGRYTQNGLHFGQLLGGHYIDMWVTKGSYNRIVAPTAGIVCYVSETYNETTLVLKGLPTKKPTAGTYGTIYVENGVLKMYTGNF